MKRTVAFALLLVFIITCSERIRTADNKPVDRLKVGNAPPPQKIRDEKKDKEQLSATPPPPALRVGESREESSAAWWAVH